MKKLFVILGAMAAVMFVSCNNKQNTDQSGKTTVLKANYSLTLFVSEAAVDQQDVIKTVVTYHDNQGTAKTEEFLAEYEDMTLKSPINFALPYNETITITQTLKEGVTLTKDKYNVGLCYSFTVNSVDDNDGVYNTKTVEEKDVCIGIRKENMAAAFPEELKFEISVDANGVVSITKKESN